MAFEQSQKHQPSVESASTSTTASPMPPGPGSPPRSDYWQQHRAPPHSRQSSDASLDLGPKSPEQPIHDAVNSAFDKSNMSSQISPDLVSQITAAVIQNIKLSGVTVQSPPPTATSRPMDPPNPPRNSSAQIPPRNVYTPPSPEVDHAKPVPPDIRVNHLDGTQSEQPQSQRYGPKMSLKKEFHTDQDTSSSQEDTSMLEKYWQVLFDSEGFPTKRLGQFLRGVAMHLIEDYEPCNSLVILPHKMRRFYEEVKLPEELYPWPAVFNGTLSNSSLSHIYRDLYCQHHFVQRNLDDKPSVPGLTPEGFQTWMTHVIRAYPDEELQRFAKVIQKYPISNADDRKERFPKQLPRCLFPKAPHKSSRHDLEDFVHSHPGLKPPRRARAPSDPYATGNAPPQPPTPAYAPLQPPNPMQQPAGTAPPPPHYAKDIPRERVPYSASSSDAPVEEANSGARLERERKQYGAAPGGASKSFEQEAPPMSGNIRRSHSNAAGTRPSMDEDASRTRHSRAESTAAAYGAGMPRRVARSPSTAGAARPSPAARSEGDLAPTNHIRDDSGEDLIKLSSRDSRGGRHIPTPGTSYEDEHQRRGPPPSAHGHGNYQYSPQPPPPRYN